MPGSSLVPRPGIAKRCRLPSTAWIRQPRRRRARQSQGNDIRTQTGDSLIPPARELPRECGQPVDAGVVLHREHDMAARRVDAEELAQHGLRIGDMVEQLEGRRPHRTRRRGTAGRSHRRPRATPPCGARFSRVYAIAAGEMSTAVTTAPLCARTRAKPPRAQPTSRMRRPAGGGRSRVRGLAPPGRCELHGAVKLELLACAMPVVPAQRERARVRGHAVRRRLPDYLHLLQRVVEHRSEPAPRMVERASTFG